MQSVTEALRHQQFADPFHGALSLVLLGGLWAFPRHLVRPSEQFGLAFLWGLMP